IGTWLQPVAERGVAERQPEEHQHDPDEHQVQHVLSPPRVETRITRMFDGATARHFPTYWNASRGAIASALRPSFRRPPAVLSVEPSWYLCTTFSDLSSACRRGCPPVCADIPSVAAAS